MQPAEVSFISGTDRCVADHYRPDPDRGRGAAIVMGHGFGATRDTGLAPFAERFAAAGFHVVCFDYRHFGDSAGQPRQLLSVTRQLEDWAAAIAFTRAQPGIDGDRVALWGSSFSGGHVAVIAARDRRVAAISSQCPMMDGRGAFLIAVRQGGVANTLTMTRLAVADWWSAQRGGRPRSIPIVGPPGSLGALTTPDAEPGYLRIAPPDFDNRVLARIVLEVPTYRPVAFADRVRCPWLIQICERDSVAPIAPAEEAARRAGARAEVVRYPCGHFDVYVEDDFERSVADQLAFFDRHLPAS